MSDPFANDPFKDDQDEDRTDTQTAEPRPARVGITLKQHGGFDAAWITVRGEDADDAVRQLVGVIEAKLPDKVAKAAAMFAETAPSGAGSGSGNRSQNRKRDDGPPPGVEQETCRHGDMQYKSGKKGNKSWSGWFCPEDDCKVIWL